MITSTWHLQAVEHFQPPSHCHQHMPAPSTGARLEKCTAAGVRPVLRQPCLELQPPERLPKLQVRQARLRSDPRLARGSRVPCTLLATPCSRTECPGFGRSRTSCLTGCQTRGASLKTTEPSAHSQGTCTDACFVIGWMPYQDSTGA
jgi:hypothetical protein